MNDLPTDYNVSSKYGAPMGRASLHPTPGKVRLYRVRLDRGGYDRGGAYWGIGEPLWCAHNDGGAMFLRAADRSAAKDTVRGLLQQARFYR